MFLKLNGIELKSMHLKNTNYAAGNHVSPWEVSILFCYLLYLRCEREEKNTRLLECNQKPF